MLGAVEQPLLRALHLHAQPCRRCATAVSSSGRIASPCVDVLRSPPARRRALAGCGVADAARRDRSFSRSTRSRPAAPPALSRELRVERSMSASASICSPSKKKRSAIPRGRNVSTCSFQVEVSAASWRPFTETSKISRIDAPVLRQLRRTQYSRSAPSWWAWKVSSTAAPSLCGTPLWISPRR